MAYSSYDQSCCRLCTVAVSAVWYNSLRHALAPPWRRLKRLSLDKHSTGKHKHWSGDMHGLRGAVPPVRFLRYKRCVTLKCCCFSDTSLVDLVYSLGVAKDEGGISPRFDSGVQVPIPVDLTLLWTWW